MHILRSLCSAFLMYSRIPMPTVEWKEENRRYSLCFFPLIGVVIGALFMLWFRLGTFLGVGKLLFGAVFAVIPVIVTGGIHLDGFCDVCDAKACCGTKEKMLEVMSDPRTGAFAVINLALYLIVQTGAYSEINGMGAATVCALGFVLSRSLSGLAAVTFRSAKGSGALWNFAKPAHRKITVFTEIVFIIMTSALMILAFPAGGAAAVVGNAFVFLYYRIFSYRKFGGITGDLAGYFLQLSELCTALCAVSAVHLILKTD